MPRVNSITPTTPVIIRFSEVDRAISMYCRGSGRPTAAAISNPDKIISRRLYRNKIKRQMLFITPPLSMVYNTDNPL